MRAVFLILSLLLIGGREGTATTTIYRIACGSQGGVDPSGNTWQSDAFYAGGARWTAANQPSLSSQPIPYQAARYTAPASIPFSYTLPVTAGDYAVTLKFIEIRTPASNPPIAIGQRIFSISINGTVVQPALDVFAVAGSLTPYSVTYPVTATGPITITLASIVGNAVLSGIQVDSTSTQPAAMPFAPYLTGTTATVPNCPPSGLAFLYVSDTAKLYWCFSGGNWNPVSDLVLTPSIFKLQAVDECQSSSTAWNCAGMYRAILSRDDGSHISLVGINMDVSSGAYPPVTWVPVK